VFEGASRQVPDSQS